MERSIEFAVNGKSLVFETEADDICWFSVKDGNGLMPIGSNWFSKFKSTFETFLLQGFQEQALINQFGKKLQPLMLLSDPHGALVAEPLAEQGRFNLAFIDINFECHNLALFEESDAKRFLTVLESV